MMTWSFTDEQSWAFAAAGWHNATVNQLAAARSLQDWASLDLRQLHIRHRVVAIAASILCLVIAFAISYAVYRHFGAPRNEFDLRIYYNALTQWRTGGDLYAYEFPDPVNGWLGFTYPPVAAILMSPMTGLPIRPVVALAGVGIFASTVGLVLLSVRQRVQLGRPQLVLVTGLATAAAFCLQPISQTAAYGQVNTILALLVMFDVFVLAPRGSRWAGVGIGLATAIKLTPAIFLLYLVVSGRWRMLRVAALTAVSATLIAGMCAPIASWRYFTSLLWDSGRVGVLDNTANQSINGTLARFVSPVTPDKIVWFVCALAIVAVGAVRIRRAVAAGDTLLAVSITGLLGVLVSPVSWIHHAVWIVPAMVVLVSRLVAAFPARSFQRLAAGPPASGRRLDPRERAGLRAWLGTALLAGSGLWVFVVNTRNTFGLPDTHYADLGLGAVLAGSVQTIWMLVAVVLLPYRYPTGARVLTAAVGAVRVES